MDVHARPLDAGDELALAPLDAAYAEAHGLEALVGAGSVRFYARTGHAFVAEGGDGGVRGFVLAQAVFDGARATVHAARLVTPPPGDDAALHALLRALTKSAYDAGVYDLRVAVPQGDLAGAAALGSQDYAPLPVATYGRRLGSRGRAEDRTDA